MHVRNQRYQSPSSETTGSDLADVGWAAANSDVDLVLRRGARVECSEIWPGGHGEGLRRTRGWPLGHSWAPTLSRESVVNVGTVLVPPSDRPAGSAAGRLVVS